MKEVWVHTNHLSLYQHSKLRSITRVATKVHVILQNFVVITWMRDIVELV